MVSKKNKSLSVTIMSPIGLLNFEDIKFLKHNPAARTISFTWVCENKSVHHFEFVGVSYILEYGRHKEHESKGAEGFGTIGSSLVQ
ncbi:MAG: hypothetical protein MN733_14200 [Nitrososphaera sp.]|nr:hypothetical protein [Nitrososphaera sp.]